MSEVSTNEENPNFIETSCKYYEYEYRDCSRLASRYWHIYDNGSKLDCSVFKNLINDCELWNKEMKQESLQNIINYEKNMIINRNKSISNNNVWAYREKPPQDWNAKLPEWAELRIKNSSWYVNSGEKSKNV